MEATKDPIFLKLLLPLILIVFIIGVGIVLLYQYYQKNIFIQKLQQETLKNRHQTDLFRSGMQAQEEERKRIAQDLHDELGSVLSIIKMNIMLLEQKSETTEGTLIPGLQNVRMLSENAIANVRNISHRLMPPQLEAFGLVKTLEAVIEQIMHASNIYIHLDAGLTDANLPWSISLDLYRIIMELINNTIKHSGATNVEINTSFKNKFILCHYSDNGKGIADSDLNKGLGLKSIEGRVKAVYGKLDFGTGPNGGFFAIIQIPLSA